MRIGVGYRQELAAWIASHPPTVKCLEITAEHFFGRDEALLAELRHERPLYVHGLGLSLGTPGPLDKQILERFARVVAAAQPEWVSEHVAFTRTAEVDLGHLNPIRPTSEMVTIVADHARAVADRVQRPIILENITSHVRPTGDLSETDFLNAVCTRADCGLLLDVTNLFVNSRNHDFDPIVWLRQLDAKRIVQMHIVGYSREGSRWTDSHGEPIQDELLELTRAVLQYAPVSAIILERDENFPDGSSLAEVMNAELQKLAGLIGRN